MRASAIASLGDIRLGYDPLLSVSPRLLLATGVLGYNVFRWVAPVAQRIEQRFPNSRLGMPMRGVRYKIELLCQSTNHCFEANVLFGGNQCFSV